MSAKKYRILLALLLILLLFFLASVYIKVVASSGQSMIPTISPGQAVFFRRCSSPSPGSVALIHHGEKWYIKRVIAVQGQTVAVDPETGTVTVDGVALSEPYTAVREPKDPSLEAWEGCYTGEAAVVPDGCYFVLGDNRAHSIDSRDVSIGFIPQNEIWGILLFSLGH